MADIFISHSSIDSAIADYLCQQLETRGISCWMAPRDIKPGEEWAKAINDAITSSSAFLVIYSKNSAASNQVPKEIGLAGARKSYVIPYKIDDTPLSGEFEYYLLGSHWIVADIHKKDYKIDELYNILSAVKANKGTGEGNGTYINQVNVTEIKDSKVTYASDKKSKLPLIIAAIAAITLIICTVIIVSAITNSNPTVEASVSDEDDDKDNDQEENVSEEEDAAATTGSEEETETTTAAETENEYISWIDMADTSWFDGSSTSYDISTPEQLAGLSVLVKNGKDMSGITFNLTKNIYLNDNVSEYEDWYNTPPKYYWYPIGNINTQFKGSFNGNGYSIYGLYSFPSAESNLSYAGLFGYVDNATITGVNLWNGLLCSAAELENLQADCAGVAACASNSTFRNCDIGVEVYSVATNDNAYAGGIVSYAKNCRIENCAYTGKVTSLTNDEFYAICGGIVGQIVECTVINSVCDGIAVADCKNSYAGGLVGDIFISNDVKDSTITNCYYNNEKNKLAFGDGTDSASNATGLKYSEIHSQETADKLGSNFYYDGEFLFVKKPDLNSEFSFTYTSVKNSEQALSVASEYVSYLRKSVENDNYTAYKKLYNSNIFDEEYIKGEWEAYKSWFMSDTADRSQVKVDVTPVSYDESSVLVAIFIYYGYHDAQMDEWLSNSFNIYIGIEYDSTKAVWCKVDTSEKYQSAKKDFFIEVFGSDTYSYGYTNVNDYQMIFDKCLIYGSTNISVFSAQTDAETGDIYLILGLRNGDTNGRIFTVSSGSISFGDSYETIKPIIDFSKGVSVYSGGSYSEPTDIFNCNVPPMDISYVFIKVDKENLISIPKSTSEFIECVAEFDWTTEIVE